MFENQRSHSPVQGSLILCIFYQFLQGDFLLANDELEIFLSKSFPRLGKNTVLVSVANF